MGYICFVLRSFLANQKKKKYINAKKVNTEKRNNDNTHMTDWQGNKNRRDNKEEIHELAQMDY